jgi:hypothetical protein
MVPMLSCYSYWVERKVLLFRRDDVSISYQEDFTRRNWKACDTLGDGNGKQWKLYNWLNIVNTFKKFLNCYLKNAKTFRSTQYILSHHDAVSLTRGQVCPLPYILVFVKHAYLYYTYTLTIFKFFMYSLYMAPVSPGFVQQIMPYLSLSYKRSLVTWTSVNLTAINFKPFIVGPVLWCEHLHFHDFLWLLLAAYIM